MHKYTPIVLLFCLTFLGLTSCKTSQKSALSTTGIEVKETETKDAKPFISSVKSNYLLRDSSTVNVFLKLSFENLPELTEVEELNKVFRTSWTLQPDFGIREKLKGGGFVFRNENTRKENGDYFVSFEVPRLRDRPQAILLMEFIDLANSRKFTNEFLISFTGERIDDRFDLFVNGELHPSFKNYIEVGEPFQVKSVVDGDYELYLKKLNYDSNPALSPMSTSKREEFARLSFDYIEVIKEGTRITIDEPGHYAIGLDSASLEGSKGFMVVDQFFPRSVEVEELKEPLFYMSTNKEITALSENEDPKDALDLYFLNLTAGNQDLSKQMVRSYFRRVAKVNQLFTTYKEGWKTDQGMVYMILGPPSSVQRNGKREVWLYNQSQSLSPIYFTFYRKSNELSADNYELVRYPEYGAYWYPFVEAWRTGSVLE